MRYYVFLASGFRLTILVLLACSLSLANAAASILGRSDPSNPLSCLSSTVSFTVIDLIICLNSYTVPRNHYDAGSYHAAQPTSHQRAAWSSVITSLLDLSNDGVSDTCATLAIPAALSGAYAISTFADASNSRTYCVLVESTANHGVYAKGWGVVIVPSTPSDLDRHLHISAPHPVFDVGTPQQAAAVFAGVGAKSLVIYGRHRMSYLAETDCIKGKTKYPSTDPTHNKLELFYDTNSAIWAWQSNNEGCPNSHCAFIQFHAKASTTCPSDTAFISTGLGTAGASIDWYQSPTPRPVKTLKSKVQKHFSNWTIALPSDDRLCSLVAMKNVVGRFMNGVTDADVCTKDAMASKATGAFVHIEQSMAATSPNSYKGWIAAVSEAFDMIHTLDHAEYSYTNQRFVDL